MPSILNAGVEPGNPTGMGYQRVDIRFANGRELKDAVVFNAQELDVPEEYARAEIRDIRLHT